MTGVDIARFDRFAPLYERLMPSASEAALRRGLMQADRTVDTGLDVAGGTGRGARAVPDVSWTVVDAARGMLREANGRGLPGVQGSATALPIRDASVDAVLVVDALHHLPDARRAVAEAERVLRPGGVLVVRDFSPRHPLGRLLVRGEHLVGFESTFYHPDVLAAMLSSVGLRPTVLDRGFTYTVAGVVDE